MIDFTSKRDCTGCCACYNICRQKAISMKADNEGFIYPLINNQLCVNCGLCEKICPVLHPPLEYLSDSQPDVYAAWSLDEEVRSQSTSGGLFSMLAGAILDSGGYVAAARYNDDKMVEHTIIHSKEELGLLRQSKYSQSTIENVFNQIKKLLDGGEKVLFCGAPCQNSGLRKFLRADYDKLYCCDFICRGVNSPKVFKNYLRYLEKANSSRTGQVWFRNKANGWNQSGIKVIFNDGKTYFKDRNDDLFMMGYLKYNLYCRPSCHQCHFKGLQRVSDITLADFWGIGTKYENLDDDKGTSLVMIYTEKGNALFRSIHDRVFSQKCCVQDALDSAQCLVSSIRPGGNRTRFFKNIDRYDFEELMRKYAKYTLKEKFYISAQKIYNILKLYIVKQKIKKFIGRNKEHVI